MANDNVSWNTQEISLIICNDQGLYNEGRRLARRYGKIKGAELFYDYLVDTPVKWYNAKLTKIGVKYAIDCIMD